MYKIFFSKIKVIHDLVTGKKDFTKNPDMDLTRHIVKDNYTEHEMSAISVEFYKSNDKHARTARHGGSIH